MAAAICTVLQSFGRTLRQASQVLIAACETESGDRWNLKWCAQQESNLQPPDS
jgi:hypothetical protein